MSTFIIIYINIKKSSNSLSLFTNPRRILSTEPKLWRFEGLFISLCSSTWNGTWSNWSVARTIDPPRWVRSSHWQESRSRENLEKKWLIFFSLELENCIFISLSLLDFQDFETKILFLFSICEIFKTILFLFLIFKIVKTKFSFYSRFMRFCSLFLFLFLREMHDTPQKWWRHLWINWRVDEKKKLWTAP